ncbi:MAG: hypothetical protein WD942_06135 [Dehalococcoidia bacterium]
MRYELNGRAIGWADDVLQLFDAAQEQDAGRHHQTEALLRGEEDIDLRLVMDECALVLDEPSLAEPVRDCARQVLLALGVDPDGPIRRDDAGTPMLKRLKRIDLRDRAVDKVTQTTSDAATGVLDATSRRVDRAQTWVKKRRKFAKGD